jgi:rhodanese-related sulfurtransferase
MKSWLAIAGAALFAAGSASAQMKVTQQSPRGTTTQIGQPQQQKLPPLSAARRIRRDDALKLARSGKAVYIDVRSFDSYSKGHIKGALSIPHSQLMTRVREIPPGKTIITYCACVEEHTAALSVLELNAHGVQNAAALVDGWKGWQSARLPTDVGSR